MKTVCAEVTRDPVEGGLPVDFPKPYSTEPETRGRAVDDTETREHPPKTRRFPAISTTGRADEMLRLCLYLRRFLGHDSASDLGLKAASIRQDGCLTLHDPAPHSPKPRR